MDIKMEREIKRALNKFCSEALINALLPFADSFYCKLFGLYGLNYTPEIFNEKRAFVTEATKHYVLKRLPKLIYQNKDKMYVMAKICTPNDLNLFFVGLINTMISCTSSEAFEEVFKTQFNTQKKSFKQELAENRSESLSEFDKNILKFTNGYGTV